VRGIFNTTHDITALNGWMELAWYYIPDFDERAKRSKNKGAGDHCSAFIATGSSTADGKIVMAHNAWWIILWESDGTSCWTSFRQEDTGS